MAPALPRLGCWCIQVPRGYHPRKSCPASAVARSSRPAPSPATHCVTQAVLDRIAKVLGSMEGTSHPGDTQNRCRLASCVFWVFWKRAFPSPVGGRSQAGEQTDSSLNFSNGCGKSNLGSAPHSWRVAQARLRSIGTNGFALGSASPETSGSHQALADFPEEPSRGDRSDGLLHCADTDLRHSVLLLRDRPRPASDPALQRDSQSQRALGCPAVSRDLGIQPTAAVLPDLRSGLQVQCRCSLDREGDGQPTDSHRIPQSLAERNCRALGWQCAAGLTRSCDRAESETSATVAE